MSWHVATIFTNHSDIRAGSGMQWRIQKLALGGGGQNIFDTRGVHKVSFPLVPSSHNSIVAAVEVGGSNSNTRRPWSMICDKVFECAEHSADPNPSSAVSGLCPHTTRRSTHILQEFSLEVFNHIHLIARTSRPVIFIFFAPQKFLPDQRQRFQNDREEEMSVTVVPIQAEDFYDAGYKSWSHGMTNVSIPEVYMLKVAQHSPYRICSNKSFH